MSCDNREILQKRPLLCGQIERGVVSEVQNDHISQLVGVLATTEHAVQEVLEVFNEENRPFVETEERDGCRRRMIWRCGALKS